MEMEVTFFLVVPYVWFCGASGPVCCI